jgi:hypothetical protein
MRGTLGDARNDRHAAAHDCARSGTWSMMRLLSRYGDSMDGYRAAGTGTVRLGSLERIGHDPGTTLPDHGRVTGRSCP